MSFEAFHEQYAPTTGPLRSVIGSAPTPSARRPGSVRRPATPGHLCDR